MAAGEGYEEEEEEEEDWELGGKVAEIKVHGNLVADVCEAQTDGWVGDVTPHRRRDWAVVEIEIVPALDMWLALFLGMTLITD
jgi:hypothetical protein